MVHTNFNEILQKNLFTLSISVHIITAATHELVSDASIQVVETSYSLCGERDTHMRHLVIGLGDENVLGNSETCDRQTEIAQDFIFRFWTD
jgi:hypothetical protein